MNALTKKQYGLCELGGVPFRKGSRKKWVAYNCALPLFIVMMNEVPNGSNVIVHIFSKRFSH